MILLVDIDYRSFSSTGQHLKPYPPMHPNHSWLPILAHTLNRSMKASGINPDIVLNFASWLEQHDAYEDVKTHDLLLPVNRWFANPGSNRLYIPCSTIDPSPNTVTDQERIANAISDLHGVSSKVSLRPHYASGLMPHDLRRRVASPQCSGSRPKWT